MLPDKVHGVIRQRQVLRSLDTMKKLILIAIIFFFTPLLRRGVGRGFSLLFLTAILTFNFQLLTFNCTAQEVPFLIFGGVNTKDTTVQSPITSFGEDILMLAKDSVAKAKITSDTAKHMAKIASSGLIKNKDSIAKSLYLLEKAQMEADFAQYLVLKDSIAKTKITSKKKANRLKHKIEKDSIAQSNEVQKL